MLGYRIYVIEGDAIRPITHKTFHGFFLREEPTLRAYSGQTLTFAMSFYEMENRRPVRIVRLETLRLTVKQDGSMDLDQYRHHLADTLAALDADASDPAGAKVFDPNKKRSPKISEKAYRSILAHLKIPEAKGSEPEFGFRES